MRAAGYRGPSLFVPQAMKLIARTSEGLTRRINILADKSLLAAFADGEHQVTAKHARAAVRDSEFATARRLPAKWWLLGVGLAAGLLVGAAFHYMDRFNGSPARSGAGPSPVAVSPPPEATSLETAKRLEPQFTAAAAGKELREAPPAIDSNSAFATLGSYGINHWAAGTVQAGGLIRYVVDGHHTGLPSFGDMKEVLMRGQQPDLWQEHTGCSESPVELVARLTVDGVSLPEVPPNPPKDNFANGLRTRLLFSCLVDADFLDTEKHFDPAAVARRVVPSLQPARGLVQLLAALAKKPATGSVNQLRRQLLADCMAAADRVPGLFTLTAPQAAARLWPRWPLP